MRTGFQHHDAHKGFYEIRPFVSEFIIDGQAQEQSSHKNLH